MKKRNASGTRKIDTSQECCLNEACPSRGLIGQGNIVIHDSIRGRLKCNICKKTFNKKRGTALEGIRKPEELFVTVISLLSWGCPIQAIVHTYTLDERTVADWQHRAGLHCEKVHQEKIEQGNLETKQAQVDEIRVKAREMVIWMGLAIMAPTRLWIAGLVSETRDSNFTDELMLRVRKCCLALSAILICVDGLKSYPKSILKAFREKVKDKPGPGAPRKEVWPDVHIGVVVKRMEKRRLKEVIHRIAYGTEEMVNALLKSSKGGKVINTSFIERLNGTFRERLASLTRKCRHAASKVETLHAGMYLIGSTYNFCIAHQQLSKALDLGGFGFPCTPAMASGLTDHVWSVKELLLFKVIPPPLPIPKKRGRPRTKPLKNISVPKKPVVRMRKGALCATTG
jgi:transposase-like protein